MNQANPPETLPLFDEHDLESVSTPISDVRESTKPQTLLALNLDHREWLSFLAEEWWPIRNSNTVLPLGVGTALTPSESSVDIVAWIDPSQLPDAEVYALREDLWVRTVFSKTDGDDKQIAWPGPLPLFAVQRFSVSDEERRAHIVAMAEGFANIALPDQSIIVEHVHRQPTASIKTLTQRFAPPVIWNALRGAAAMATWSVPGITPWLTTLCQMLSKPGRPSRPRKLPDTDTPWLLDTPWRYLTGGPAQNNNERSVVLWRAMLTVFSSLNMREAWRPSEVLEQICDEARRQGIAPESLDSLLLDTGAILEDRKMIDSSLSSTDPMGFVLQLILLRPRPEQFITWRATFPTLPPALLWSGAILSGLLNGYRNLEVRFRSKPSCRRLLDLKTWTLASKNNKLSWPNSPAEQLSVTITDGVAQLLSGDEVWTERKLGRRGRWYAANLDQPKTQQQAIAIARANCPQALSQAVLLPTGRSKLDGSGLIVLEKTKKDLSRFLAVQGDVYLPLQEGAQIVTRLDQDYFRRWVAIAALDKQIPDIYETETKVSAPRPPVVVSNEIEGLRVIPEFLSTEQERGLVSTVNAASWSTELKRRVQHYGWKYDYRARKISASAYLGPLPDWAQTLAQRLFDEGLMPEIADQVIVNEYVLQQGISKHIDCLDCFRGPVVTISLLESWQMTFRKASEKFDLVLKQRSATIIDGAARYEWTHEIPARRYEGEALRSRRISLTFRKVNL